MAKNDDSEDRLIQEPPVECLNGRSGWETLFAQDEVGFGPEGLLGRASDREPVLPREVLAARR